MNKKQKACRAKGLAKEAGGCGNIDFIWKFGLCRKCYMNWVYSCTENANKEKAKFFITARKKASSDRKREKVNYDGKIQEKSQELVRLIDLGWECLATGKMATAYDGGHVHGKGAHRECRLNLHNIFAQESGSNRSTQDDILMIEGVERVFGLEYKEFVSGLANKPLVKHSKEEVEQMYRKACKIANRLKREGKKRTLQERITLRNEINTEIGYYPPELSVFQLE